MSEQAALNNKYVGYADYKDSRVEELGRLPATWGVKKVNYLFSFGRGLNITKANLEDTGIPVVNYGEVHSKYGFVVDPVIHPLKCVSSEYLKTNPGALLRRGDFVFADTSEDLEGAGNFTHFDGSCDLFAGYHTVVLRPQHDNLPRFLAYAFDSLECRSQVKLAVKGVKVFSVTQGILKDVALPVPPIEEQRTIAAFLDYETARIDSLIDKQQRLIELLKEKRQAVISHAVTKGLNPAAPMKDSGVEWLGQVPEHWGVTRAKLVSDIFVPQRNKPELNDSGVGVNWATMEDMKSDNIKATKRFVSIDAFEAAGSKVLRKGAVVASCVGNFGIASVLDVDVVINQQLQAYIPKKISAPYLRDLIGCSKVYFDLVGTAATLVYVNQEGFGNLPVPLPPMDEQKDIEQYTKCKKELFDKAISKGLRQVALLQERRTALISAAVTGKIDLRGWTPPVKEDAA